MSRLWALRADEDGGAAVEFVLIAPLFLFLAIGVVVYGGWFWMANSVQSLASEAARSAIGGLDAAEQTQLARGYVEAEADRIGGVDPERTVAVVRTSTTAIEVEVVYDATQAPIFAFDGLAPMPPKIIRRSAVVLTGGY